MAWIDKKGALKLLAQPHLNLWVLGSLRNHPDPEIARLASEQWEQRRLKAQKEPQPPQP